MKRLVPVLFAVLALLGCAGLPQPESHTDALVIGSIVLDFRDGFFSAPPRKIDSGVRLDFTNVTTGKSFWVMAERGGYFYFLSNGGDRYKLSMYSFDAHGRGSGRLTYEFASTPHAIQYLGHFEVTYRNPRMVDRRQGFGTYWDFDVTTAHVDHTGEMQTYLAAAGSGATWADYETRSEWTLAAPSPGQGSTKAARSFFELVQNGSLDSIQAAIGQGADVKTADSTGMTPLMYAARDNRDPQVITALVNAGADLEARDRYGWTALMIAARRNRNPEVLAALLNSGADAKAVDSNGDNALVHAQDNEQLPGTDALAQLEKASRQDQ